MRKLVVAMVAVAVGSMAVIAAPADAQASRLVTIQVPSVSQAGQYVVVQGRAPARATLVRIERRVGDRWALVRRAKVTNGRYLVRLRPAAGVTKFRARVDSRYSAARTLRVVRPPTTTTAKDACGTRPAKADGSLWACTFNDDFSASTLDRTKWMPQTQFGSGVQTARACYLDDPSVINQANGFLNLTVRKVADPVSCSFGGLSGPTDYVGGSVTTYHLFSQQYGRFEAKIKNTATTSPGLHEAFWLWPDDRVPSTALWPYAGEIDISETYSSHPNLSIPFLHYSADVYGSLPGTNTAWNCTANRGVWNTYTLEWSANRLEIKVNGKTCLVNTSGDPAFQKPYIMTLSQMLGAAGNVYDGRAPMPATMSVDYVKVWK